MGIKRERQREIRIKEIMRKTHKRDRAGWRRNNEAFAWTKYGHTGICEADVIPLHHVPT